MSPQDVREMKAIGMVSLAVFGDWPAKARPPPLRRFRFKTFCLLKYFS